MEWTCRKCPKRYMKATQLIIRARLNVSFFKERTNVTIQLGRLSTDSQKSS